MMNFKTGYTFLYNILYYIVTFIRLRILEYFKNFNGIFDIIFCDNLQEDLNWSFDLAKIYNMFSLNNNIYNFV